MDKPFRVHMMQPLHQLAKIWSRYLFREPARVSYIVKELSPTRVLKYDSRTCVLRAILLSVLGFRTAVYELDDVLMVEVLDDLDLIFKCLQVPLGLVLLDGYLDAIGVFSKLDPE